MYFSHVTLSVKNLEESLLFYQDIVGLPVKRRFSPMPGLEIVFLGKGETEIELIANQAHTDIDIGQDVSLGFAAGSLEETAKLMKEKGIDIGEISSPGPQVKYFFVSDPNGVKIQFIKWVKGRD